MVAPFSLCMPVHLPAGHPLSYLLSAASYPGSDRCYTKSGDHQSRHYDTLSADDDRGGDHVVQCLFSLGE